MLRETTIALVGIALVASHASVARAQLSFNVGAVTDYRYRGISQTRLKPALQSGVDYAHAGFYLGAWASTVQWVRDGGGGADAEVDFFGGYKGDIRKSLGYDIGALTYRYPKNRLTPSANTSEIYLALTAGPVMAK